MLQTHPVPNVPEPRVSVRAGRIRLAPGFAAGLGLLLGIGCTSPGMKLDVKPQQETATSKMGDMDVTLHHLGPQAILDQQAKAIDPSNLAGLTENKPEPYLIGPQDILLVTVWDHPELTLALGSYRTDNATGSVVEDDGYMYFPYVGRILMKGLTLSQARTRITEGLAKVLKNPQVDIKFLAFRSQKVYVGGEVKNPATYNVTDVPFTLSEAVNRAGGFTTSADDSKLVLTRDGRSWVLDFQALMSRSSLGDRIYLKDGDTLMVPAGTDNPVYLMGEVVKPGTFPMVHGNMSLARALSDAGGILGASADARSIYVIRGGAVAKSVDVYHLDARNPTAMVLADNFQLSPRDFVYVDAGTLVRFNRVMGMVLPTVTSVIGATTNVYQIRYFKRTN